MPMLSWIRGLFARPAVRKGPRRVRPAIETLEDRLTPSMVTNASDSGPGSLRYEIAHTASNGTIDFSSGLSGATITLRSTLDVNANVTITGLGAANLAISGGNAFQVFSVAAGTNVAIDSVTITGGRGSEGAGIYNAGTLTLANCRVSGNSAQLFGGGVFNDGTATVEDSTISGNTAGTGAGGGIYNHDDGTLIVDNSTISRNSANSDGGGIFSNGTSVAVDNSTICGNSAQQGGGVYNIGSGTLTLADSTISGNSALQGGGMANLGTGALANTIMAGNNGGNVLDPGSGLADSSDFIGGNAMLAALGNYGGPTQTMPPLAGSPVIDAGNSALVPSGITTDQRGTGYLRIVNAAVDIGAVEVQNVAFSALSSPTIIQGTASTTLTGHLGSGTIYPSGSSVSITLNSVTRTAVVNGSGNFTTTFSTGSLTAAGSPYPITYYFAGSTGFNSAVDTSTTLTVTQAAPAFDPFNGTTVIIGTAGSLTLTATASPMPSLSYSSSPGLPGGFIFDTPSAGTGVLHWSSALAHNTFGTYAITIYASCRAGTASQTFPLTVVLPPTITSPSTATLPVGSPETFTVTASASPAATFSPITTNPASGVTLSASGLLTVPATTPVGTYTFTITASNGYLASAPRNAQTFTLHVVNVAPAFISPNHAAVAQGGSFTVAATGAPAPTLSAANLASGITLDPSTGVLSVAPTAALGSHTFTITAANAGGTARQIFTLTVTAPLTPGVFAAVQDTPTVVLGTAGSITVSVTGNPMPSLSYSSSPGLPGGFIFNTPAAGTGVLTWSSALAANTMGTYTITIYAASSAGTTTQTLILGIEKPNGPTISITNSTTPTSETIDTVSGGAGSFTVSATGNTTPLTCFSAAALPAGVVFNPATGVVSWTAVTASPGSYPITFIASNAATGSRAYAFTINVVNA